MVPEGTLDPIILYLVLTVVHYGSVLKIRWRRVIAACAALYSFSARIAQSLIGFPREDRPRVRRTPQGPLRCAPFKRHPRQGRRNINRPSGNEGPSTGKRRRPPDHEYECDIDTTPRQFVVLRISEWFGCATGWFRIERIHSSGGEIPCSNPSFRTALPAPFLFLH